MQSATATGRRPEAIRRTPRARIPGVASLRAWDYNAPPDDASSGRLLAGLGSIRPHTMLDLVHDSISRPRRVLGIALLAALCGAAVCARAVQAQELPGSSAVIAWDVPGDDADQGQATYYELRFRATPIAPGDTASWWRGATLVSGLPTPGPAGSVDSVTVTGLNPSMAYWFVLRVGDEIPNWSGFSNVVEKPAFPDGIRPAQITDLDALPGSITTSPRPESTAKKRPPSSGPPR